MIIIIVSTKNNQMKNLSEESKEEMIQLQLDHLSQTSLVQQASIDCFTKGLFKDKYYRERRKVWVAQKPIT